MNSTQRANEHIKKALEHLYQADRWLSLGKDFEAQEMAHMIVSATDNPHAFLALAQCIKKGL